MNNHLPSTTYRIAALWLILVLSSCSQKPEANNLNNLSLNQLTYDEKLLLVSKDVPGFAGFHFDHSGDLVLSFKNTIDLNQPVLPSVREIEATKNAMTQVFGEDILIMGLASRSVDVSIVDSLLQTRIQSVPYSFKELYSWYSIVTSLPDRDEISFTDIDEVKNRIVVGLIPSTRMVSEARLTKALSGTEIPSDAVQFIEKERISSEATLKDYLRPLRGGALIDQVPGTLCTLGMVVKVSGQRGVLTNSHCSEKVWEKDNTYFYQPYSSYTNAFVGFETLDPKFFTNATASWCPATRACRNSDSLFIRSENSLLGSVWKTRRRNSGSLEIQTNPDPMDEYVSFFKMSGKEYANPPGTLMHKVGARTGWSSGEVVLSCAAVYADVLTSDGRRRYMRCNSSYQANSDGGDSGSPVFERRVVNGRYYHVFHGLHWGSGSYSGIGPIEQDLGPITLQ